MSTGIPTTRSFLFLKLTLVLSLSVFVGCGGGGGSYRSRRRSYRASSVPRRGCPQQLNAFGKTRALSLKIVSARRALSR